jgi:hypothetical protein
MKLGNFKKQPAEVLDYDIDYTAWMPTGDTLLSATAVVDIVGAGSLIVDSIVVTSSTNIVKLWMSGGVDGVAYKVTVTIITNGGRAKEDEIQFSVKNF